MTSSAYFISPAQATSSSNAAATATISAVPGAQIEGVTLHWSYSAEPTNGKVTVKRASTTISEVDVTSAGPGYLPLVGFRGDVGEALSATIAAGGTGVVGKVALSARYGG